MAKALWQTVAEVKDRASVRATDWQHKISDHVAFGLLVYTGLNIYFTMGAVKGSSSGSVLPYFSLIVLVAAIIPGCRAYEKKWERLVASNATDAELSSLYKRDRFLIWAAAILLPLLVTFLIKAIVFAF